MKYVAEISTGATKAAFNCKGDTSFRVVDLVKGKSEIVSCAKLPYKRGILGVAKSKMEGYLATTYTEKTVRLFDYIEKFWPTTSIKNMEVGNFDLVTVDVGCAIRKSLHGSSSLCVNILQEPHLGGHMCSVAQLFYPFMGALEFYNLYEFLGVACRMLNMNIMRYERFMICCRYSETSVIQFRHTPEADRFFIKMYIDIGRGA